MPLCATTGSGVLSWRGASGRGVRGGVDGFAVVDALQVDGRDSDVEVTESALSNAEVCAFAGHLDGVRVAKLVRCEAASDTGADAEATQGGAGGCGGPWSPACRPVEDADESPDGQFDPYFEPWVQVLPGQQSMSDHVSALLERAHELWGVNGEITVYEAVPAGAPTKGSLTQHAGG